MEKLYEHTCKHIDEWDIDCASKEIKLKKKKKLYNLLSIQDMHLPLIPQYLSYFLVFYRWGSHFILVSQDTEHSSQVYLKKKKTL